MELRIARETDAQQVVDLLTAVFPHVPRTCRSWRWSCITSPGVAVVAVNDGAIIGHHSFRFQRFELDGRQLMGAFGQQTAVRHDHRNLAAAVALYQEAERLAGAHCHFAYGFPNRRMSVVNEKVLGYHMLSRFEAWELPQVEFVQRVAQEAIPPDPALSVRRIACASEVGFDGPFPGAHCHLRPLKDASWLQWRYFEHPLTHFPVFAAHRGTRCLGYVVLKLYHDGCDLTGHIVEMTLFAGETSVRWVLLQASAAFFGHADAKRVVIWNQDAQHQVLFEGLGFRPTGFTTCLAAKPLGTLDLDVAGIPWSFDMGTSDAF